MLEFNVDREETIDMIIKDVFMVSVDDYEKLKNLPLLDGVVIKGNIKERDPTVPDWAKEKSKPAYTADEVGAIGSADAMSIKEIDQIFNGL